MSEVVVMQFYNDFNAMFNAQSNIKQDMSVFNDFSVLDKMLHEYGFERFRSYLQDNGPGYVSVAHYAIRPIPGMFRPVMHAYYEVERAKKLDPSWVALNSDLNPLSKEMMESFEDNKLAFDAIVALYSPSGKELKLDFFDLDHHHIQDFIYHVSPDTKSITDGMKQIGYNHYERAYLRWGQQLHEFKRRMQDTLKLAERYQNFCANFKRNGEVVASGSHPSEYYGVADTSYGTDYTDTINFD